MGCEGIGAAEVLGARDVTVQGLCLSCSQVGQDRHWGNSPSLDPLALATDGKFVQVQEVWGCMGLRLLVGILRARRWCVSTAVTFDATMAWPAGSVALSCCLGFMLSFWRENQLL